MYFPAPSFIAPLLREWEPKRLFNIISSSQYIIPQQILVYLQTRLKYIASDEEGEQGGGGCWRVGEEGRVMAVASLCESKSLMQGDRKRGRHIWWSRVSHQDVKLIQRQTTDGNQFLEAPCASLSHETNIVPVPSSSQCRSCRRGLSHLFCPPWCLRPGSTWLRCCLPEADKDTDYASFLSYIINILFHGVLRLFMAHLYF